MPTTLELAGIGVTLKAHISDYLGAMRAAANSTATNCASMSRAVQNMVQSQTRAFQSAATAQINGANRIQVAQIKASAQTIAAQQRTLQSAQQTTQAYYRMWGQIFGGSSGGGGLSMTRLTGAGLMLEGINAAISQTSSVVERAITLAMDYETALAAFEVMAGGFDRGKKLLDSIQEFSVASPFSVKSLHQAAKTLAGYGVEIENVMPTLKALGEVTAATGGGVDRFERLALAYGQVMAKGFLKGEELRQFANAGVSIRDIASGIGLSVDELMAKMKTNKVTANDMATAMNKLAFEGGRLDGVMRKWAETSQGRWDIIKNTFSLGLMNVGKNFLEGMKSGGAFDILQRWMDQFRDFTANMDKWTEIGKAIRAILLALEVAGSRIWQGFKNAGEELSNMGLTGKGVRSIAEGIAGMFAALPGYIGDAYNAVTGFFYFLRGGVKKIIAEILDAMHNLLDGLNEVKILGYKLFDINPGYSETMFKNAGQWHMSGDRDVAKGEAKWKIPSMGDADLKKYFDLIDSVVPIHISKFFDTGKLRTSFTDPDITAARSFIKELAAKEGKLLGGDSFAGDLSLLSGLHKLRRMPGEGGIGDTQLGDSLQEFKMKLEKIPGVAEMLKAMNTNPSTMMLGSAAAQDFLNQRNQNLTLEQLLDVAKRAYDRDDQFQQELIRQFNNWKGSNFRRMPPIAVGPDGDLPGKLPDPWGVA